MEQKTLFRWSAGEPVKKMQLSATAEPEAPRRDLDGVIHFIEGVSAFARAGYIQLAVVGLSSAWLLFRLVTRRLSRAPSVHSKASSIRLVWESLSQLSRAAAAAFIVLATLRDRRYWVDAVPLVYAFVLGLARPLYNNKQWRLAALLQVNLALTFSFLTLVSGEVLPLLIANNHEVLPKAIKTALACTTAAVVVAVCTPREWQPDLRILEVMDTTPEPSPEETCSIAVHYWTYEWLTPLMWKGARGDLTMDDLPSLPSYDEPLLLLRRINDARAKGKTTLWTILRFLHRELIKMVFCTALAFSLDLVAPYGMYQLLGYLANPKGSPILPWAWLSLMFLGPVLKSISFQQYIFTSTRLIVRLTSALTQQLYYRAMTSMELEEDIFADKDEAGKDKKDGADADAAGAEGSADTKEAIGKATNAGRLANLMSSDIDSIWQGRDMIMIGVGAPIGTILTMIGLSRLLGWAAIAGAAVMLIGTPVPVWIGQLMGSIQGKLKQAQDSRISLITEYLGSIRAVKYFAWEKSMIRKVDLARAKEQALLWRIAILWVWLGEIIQVLPVIAMLVIFTIHVAVQKQQLTAATAFTTITLLGNLTRNLGMSSVIARYVTGAYVSIQRLEKYFASTTPRIQHPDGPLRVVNATFRRNRKATFLLRNISIDFVEGGLNVITGQSGSGKTTLLLSLLGETILESGSVTCPRDVAYASQTSWLQNDTIRENIIFNSPFDQARYDRVLDACCLGPDLAELPKGDETVVGENGTSLSGGQRARVALARALYSHAPLVILDDVFSALDTKTSAALWRRCFCTDMLQGRTIVLVAQHPWIASQADLVIKLENGEVESAEQNIGVVRRPVLLHRESETVVADESGSASRTISGTATPAEVADNEENGNGKKKDPSPSPQEMDDISDEMEASGKSHRLMFLRYMSYFGGPAYTVLVFALICLYQATLIASALWLSVWVDAYSYRDAVNIAFYLGIYVAISLGELVVDGLTFLVFENGGWIAAKKLHETCLRAVMAAPLSWYNKVPVGRIVNRFSRDINSIDTSLPQMLRYFLELATGLLFEIGAVSSIMPVFILPAAVTCFCGIFAGEMYTRTAVVVKRLVSSSRSPVFSQFGDSLAGLAVIRARADMPKIFGDRLAERLRSFSRASEANYNCNRWVSVRIDFVTAAVSLAAGAIAISKAGIVAAGLVGFSLSNATSLSWTIMGLVRSMNEVEVELQCFDRVREYASLEPEEKQDEADQAAREAEASASGDGGPRYADDAERVVPKDWPKTGRVEFRNVTIRYDLNGPDILTDINLTFDAGERVAVVGRTGSGKSTLVLSLLRFTHIVKGRILYDGVDIEAVPRERLRSSLTIIPQEAVLFNGDVASNLDPTGTAPRDLLQRALDSCSGIASFQYHDSGTSTPQPSTTTTTEPANGSSTAAAAGKAQPAGPAATTPTTAATGGESSTLASADESAAVAGTVAGKAAAATTKGVTLSTVVEPKGENFSHGQRQVLSLCRALVRRSRLMLLDEATASMDYKTDRGIQEVLRAELANATGPGDDNRTLVTIAHRLRTIADYDKVVVMGGGKVLECGSPRDLLNAKGQFYDMLHHSGEFEELVELIG